jgi:hypothetical protein
MKEIINKQLNCEDGGVISKNKNEFVKWIMFVNNFWKSSVMKESLKRNIPGFVMTISRKLLTESKKELNQKRQSTIQNNLIEDGVR